MGMIRARQGPPVAFVNTGNMLAVARRGDLCERTCGNRGASRRARHALDAPWHESNWHVFLLSGIMVEWGKKKRRKESKPMCYNFENGIFRYGVFFGLWKSVRFWNIWGLDGSMSRGKEIKESSNVFGIVMISFFFYLLGGKDWWNVSNYLSTQLYLTRDN